nr:hypothetical protein [Demequina sp. NBRC 110051]
MSVDLRPAPPVAQLLKSGSHHQSHPCFRQDRYLATEEVTREVAHGIGPHLFRRALVDDDRFTSIGRLLHALAQAEVLIDHRLHHGDERCAIFRVKPPVHGDHAIGRFTDPEKSPFTTLLREGLAVFGIQPFLGPRDEAGELLEAHVARSEDKFALSLRQSRRCDPLPYPLQHPRDHGRCLDAQLSRVHGASDLREDRHRLFRGRVHGRLAAPGPFRIAKRLAQLDEPARLGSRAAGLR